MYNEMVMIEKVFVKSIESNLAIDFLVNPETCVNRSQERTVFVMKISQTELKFRLALKFQERRVFASFCGKIVGSPARDSISRPLLQV